MHIKKSHYFILCSLLVLAFFVSLFIYYAIPILRGNIQIQEKHVSEDLLLAGNDSPPEISGLTELPPGLIININTAPADELAALPGIGETLAGEIIKYREKNGPFSKIEEITDVPGIGKGKFEAMKEYIAVS